MVLLSEYSVRVLYSRNLRKRTAKEKGFLFNKPSRKSEEKEKCVILGGRGEEGSRERAKEAGKSSVFAPISHTCTNFCISVSLAAKSCPDPPVSACFSRPQRGDVIPAPLVAIAPT